MRVCAARVITDPAPLMFDSLVTRELASELPAMSPGWGAYAGLAVCIVALVLLAGQMVLRTIDQRSRSDEQAAHLTG
ncbi:hypothetical protein GII33_03285 [Gordonia pseudamarae]|jgi:hypothetical protein|uniref:Uncharacterized protein n=1 Tax=Gordonia pseudamarae TaxID=2831662 RepID=A0ABX6IFN7_9ACTN|nr:MULTISPECIES: hypothetical protein [Gordonia]MBD0021574.1 hypothetical protein [Gordonia sp. (in: high G+C Gram-positive bacteria)]QHN25142.1 hypothetical protein GII33_03285 [Gordonia pseudamarae]QHN34075.1 hypothetical protein GII31_03280 [Gordonia pseudamarae]